MPLLNKNPLTALLESFGEPAALQTLWLGENAAYAIAPELRPAGSSASAGGQAESAHGSVEEFRRAGSSAKADALPESAHSFASRLRSAGGSAYAVAQRDSAHGSWCCPRA